MWTSRPQPPSGERKNGLTDGIHPDQGDVCQKDYRIITRRGEVRWISHKCLPVKAEDGTHLGRRASNLEKLLLPALKPGPYLKLSVSDSGKGMDAETLQRIFEPYFTTKEVGKGTGLGLAVVHGIVQRHGGEITVRSQLGEGSVFEVYLPGIVEKPVDTLVSSRPLPTGSPSGYWWWTTRRRSPSWPEECWSSRDMR